MIPKHKNNKKFSINKLTKLIILKYILNNFYKIKYYKI